MPQCNPCERWFNTNHAYYQHMDNSAAHRPQYESSSEDERWECEVCDYTFSTEQRRHEHYSSASGHPYCIACQRMFQNENNLTQHLHSKIHVGSSIQCPWCKEGFATASGATIHLESGRCKASGLNRQKINTLVQQLDRRNVITKPLLTTPGYGNEVETMATDRAWNGRAYECSLCYKEFSSLNGLNCHIRSPVHDQNIYHCPKASCGREYRILSGLVQHMESESCGVIRFAQLQQRAKSGVQNMVGRMIMN